MSKKRKKERRRRRSTEGKKQTALETKLWTKTKQKKTKKEEHALQMSITIIRPAMHYENTKRK